MGRDILDTMYNNLDTLNNYWCIVQCNGEGERSWCLEKLQ